MTTTPDSRIAVRFGSAAEAAGAALLIEAGGDAGAAGRGGAVAYFSLPASAHAPGCACCLPRGPVAVALGRLFLARARGEAALFGQVVAVTSSAAGRAAVRAALRDDVVTRARFRLLPETPQG